MPSIPSPSSTWHHPTDVQARKLLMAQLRSHPAVAHLHSVLLTRETSWKGPTLLQRLEWLLYHSAGSLREYVHHPSLERRVQGLVTLSKRKQSLNTSPVFHKHQKLQLTITEDEQDPACRLEARECVLMSKLDLLPHICSFLTGTDVLRCRLVNKLLYVHAPSFVRALHIDVASTAHTLRGFRTLLHECKHLESLTISNESNQTHVKAGVTFPKASRPSIATETASYGHEVVCHVAAALATGACPLLETLQLVAPFDVATESDAVVSLLQAFASEHVVRKCLLNLILEATFLGDHGIEHLATLLQMGCFRELETLVVRNNFMGETGCRALLQGIEPFRALHTLDLRFNILTDTDALALADVLDMRLPGQWETLCGNEEEGEERRPVGLAGLRTLQLDENFITCNGFHAITIALCSRDEVVTMSR
ncbi:hypothetical protein PsorP6_013066 [Peronosclerospora sorghi]|uniref:Uncharacterized protein n=1 Tax=Peronosclerospora sorghi TaxID=230839 RepID=A0ACC0WHD1_9STRA|nr:hypothetical protein PsorP6_013066 [Peronosclerospora sorghi]